ncbi:hypothetical protein [Glaciihabitans sp. GrIS 2.15]|uniref:hypothetical protein n=1 Tax=Glaciihabitans sp. GrIS 2.15 TaxID=3071710 RepID=UPI002DF82235|nr:hypothetical protein [Glaciihabitans sp. GrIS 2.15]
MSELLSLDYSGMTVTPPQVNTVFRGVWNLSIRIRLFLLRYMLANIPLETLRI